MHVRQLALQLELARESKCTHAVMLGDIFDHPFPDQDSQIILLQFLASASDLQWLIFPGNHDVKDSSNVSLKLLRKLPEAGALRHVRFAMDRALLQWGGLRVAVIPWSDKVPQNLSRHAELALFHNSLVGAMRDNGHRIPVGKGLPPSVFDGVPAIGGHLHTPHRLGNILYPGTFPQQDFGEAPVKRFFTMEVKPQGKVSFSSVKVHNPPWRLKVVDYIGSKTPPCNEPDTFYKVVFGEERPTPTWLTDHPRVVRVEGKPNSQVIRVAEQTAKLVGKSGGEDDRTILSRWLHHHGNVDVVSRAVALRLHDKLSQEN